MVDYRNGRWEMISSSALAMIESRARAMTIDELRRAIKGPGLSVPAREIAELVLTEREANEKLRKKLFRGE
jgi:hypothetical protein